MPVHQYHHPCRGRLLGGALALVLAGTLAAAPPQAAQAAPGCALSAAQEPAAVAMAKACGARVEIESQRSEYEEVFAEPNGEQTSVTSLVPVRAKRLDGRWGAVDTTLQRSGDALVPTAIATSVRFSLGGDGPFATIVHDGGAFSLSWPGWLPTPTVAGDAATYHDVVPGADLMVRATPTGFSHFLVVRTRAAAADPLVRQSRYRIGGDAPLRATAEGGFVAGTAGKVVATADSALMWDTPKQPSAREVAMSGPEQLPLQKRRVSAEVGDGRLTLRPDLSMLDDPAARFPIVIDPTWNGGQNRWAYATNNNENGPTTDSNVASGDPSPAAAQLRVGNDPDSARTYRSFMRFPLTTVADKHVTGGKLAGRVDHTWKCSENRSNYFYRTSSIGTTPRQAWPGPAMSLYFGANAVHANEASCDEPNDPFEVSSADLVDDLQYGANNWADYTIGISAGSGSGGTGESTTDRYMRYFLADFKLHITYNTKPGVPSALTADGKACATGATRPFIKTTTPSLRAKATDADNNSMTVKFEAARVRYNGAAGAVSMTPQQAGIPHNGTALVTLPAGLLEASDIVVATGDWDADGFPDAIVRDGLGDLFLMPGAAGGTFLPKISIGWSYGPHTFGGMGDYDGDGHQDYITREDTTGIVWLYPGTGGRTAPAPRVSVATGWTNFGMAGVADYDNDGHVDILARDNSGNMYLYPGESTRGPSTQARVVIGSGYSTSGITYFGTGDWDRNGTQDFVIIDGAGDLWAYSGPGARAITTGRFKIGSGFTGYTGRLIGSLNADANVDVLAKQPSTTAWVVYPGSGTTGPIAAARWTVATTGVANQTAYAYRAIAYDGTDWGTASGWCEFEVDTIAPAVPTVTADIYKEGLSGCPGQACGSVGMTGRFTFTSSPDTASFLWGFSDPPTTVLNPPALGATATLDWTPDAAGPRTLYVRAVDRAGNESNRQYQFYVAAPSPAKGRWLLNDPAGSGQLADDTGNGHVATADGVLGVPGRIAPGRDGLSRSAMQFDGSSTTATAASAMGDTSRSFSVAAWMNAGSILQNRYALQQPGSTIDAFRLGTCSSGLSNVWCFTLTGADTALPTYYSVSSTSLAKTGVWTHVAGVYDSTAKEARLYVNGTLEATATGVSGWDANGPLQIGKSWIGSLSEVQVFDRVISATEVFKIYDPVLNALVGKWDMSDVGPGPTYDASNLFHDIDFYPTSGGPQIPPANSGHTGTGLLLDGIDDHARTNEPVLYTDQSYTVSAWVNMSPSATGNRIALAQHGTSSSGFFLKHEAVTGKWQFVYGETDAQLPGVSVNSLAVAQKGVWVHLVGVYNAQSGQISFWLNGVLQGTAAVTNPWNATGPLNFGRVLFRGNLFEHWQGSIDEVRIYQGVVSDLSKIS